MHQFRKKALHPSVTLVNTSPEELTICLGKTFILPHDPPPTRDLLEQLTHLPHVKRISFDTSDMDRWDSALVSLLTGLHHHCQTRHIHLDTGGLPRGARRLSALAVEGGNAPEMPGTGDPGGNLFFTTGAALIRRCQGISRMVAFIGGVFWALFLLIRGRAPMGRERIFPILKSCTSDALPIVSLISCLVGLILAFVGAVQLVMFGAQIYVASLVGIAMVRVMGAVMAGVIMAGRTGAAFAAQLGTMEVNEEIDALRTLGMDPTTFLVVPRVVALATALPLLCIYADIMGILGGLLVGVFMLDLNVMEYLIMTRQSVSPVSFWIGLFQSLVFGVLVALAGCYKGMQCSRSASAVGEAATGAVVSGIVAIVVATAIITVLCNVVGI